MIDIYGKMRAIEANPSNEAKSRSERYKAREEGEEWSSRVYMEFRWGIQRLWFDQIALFGIRRVTASLGIKSNCVWWTGSTNRTAIALANSLPSGCATETRVRRRSMEGSESEAVFGAFDLNPQLFLNEVLNAVDGKSDSAFDLCLQFGLLPFAPPSRFLHFPIRRVSLLPILKARFFISFQASNRNRPQWRRSVWRVG